MKYAEDTTVLNKVLSQDYLVVVIAFVQEFSTHQITHTTDTSLLYRYDGKSSTVIQKIFKNYTKKMIDSG